MKNKLIINRLDVFKTEVERGYRGKKGAATQWIEIQMYKILVEGKIKIEKIR